MTKVFLDSDVILDFLLDRDPFAQHAGLVAALGERGSLLLSTSTLSFMNVLYIAGSGRSPSQVRDIGRKLRRIVGLLPVTAEAVDAAIASDARDPEDYVQYAVARAAGFDFLLTRNVKDYPDEPAFVMQPATFLSTLPDQHQSR
jgi:predicted nucleic acid-binding protein